MDFTTLQSELTDYLGDSSTTTFPTADRQRYLNRGQLYVAKRTKLFKKSTTKNVVAAQRTYNLTTSTSNGFNLTDFLEFDDPGIVYEDFDGNFVKLERKTISWLDENVVGWRETDSTNQSDQLDFYATYDYDPPIVYFHPVPLTAVTGGFIINYVARPTDLSAGADEPFGGDIRFEPYHELLVFYAAYRLLLKTNLVEKAMLARQEYEAGLQRMVQELRSEGDYEPTFSVYDYRASNRTSSWLTVDDRDW